VWKENIPIQADTIRTLKEQIEAGAAATVRISDVVAAITSAKGISETRVYDICNLESYEDTCRALATKPNKNVRAADELIYPTTGWIGKYLTYAQGNESHLAFHFWSAVTAMGAAAKRNFFIDMGVFNVFPNHYTLLIADAGVKKGTAYKIAEDILKRLNSTLEKNYSVEEDDLITLLPQKMGPEVLVKLLASGNTPRLGPAKVAATEYSDAVGFLGVPELSSLISKQVFHADMMIELLTDLYDCHEKWVGHTIGRGKEVLHNVAISLLWCSTPEWAAENCTDSLFSGGFMSRIIPCWRGDELGIREFPRPVHLDPVSANALAEALVPIATAPKTLVSVEDWEWYDDWYHRNKERSKVEMNPKMKGYLNRKDNHLLGLAMVLALSEGNTTISVDCLQQALAFLEHEEEVTYPKLFAGMAQHEDDAKAEAIYRIIKNNPGPIARSALMNKGALRLVGTAATLDKYIETLRARGWVRVAEKKPGTRGVKYEATR
jgi:hypothetical protein